MDDVLRFELLKPKYIIPTIGEYRHQYALRELAKTLNYEEDHVLLLENGDVVNFKEDEMYVGYKDIKVGEILSNGKAEICFQIPKKKRVVSV